MGTMTSQITILTIVYSTVYSGADKIKHQSSASLAFVREIHRWPLNSPHKGPVTQKMFPFDDVIMKHKEPYACAYHSIIVTYQLNPCHKMIAQSDDYFILWALYVKKYLVICQTNCNICYLELMILSVQFSFKCGKLSSTYHSYLEYNGFYGSWYLDLVGDWYLRRM